MEDSSFSLSHPNQYFIESQKALGGGKDPKREVDVPQKVQETSQHLAETSEDLEALFKDG